MDMASYCVPFLPGLCFYLSWPNLWLTQTWCFVPISVALVIFLKYVMALRKLEETLV